MKTKRGIIHPPTSYVRLVSRRTMGSAALFSHGGSPMIFDILRRYGFRRNSRSLHDYERAKQMIVGNNWIDNYDQTIQAICDYLGV